MYWVEGDFHCSYNEEDIVLVIVIDFDLVLVCFS